MSQNNFIKIRKGSKAYVSTHFDEHELRCRSSDAPEVFLMDYNLVLALELTRDYTDSPINPSSTYRTPNHKRQVVKSLGAANDSKHTGIIGNLPATEAVDFSFSDNNEVNILLIRKAFEERNYFYQQLRQCGINAIGFYDTFIHIDTRGNGGLQKDGVYGSFAMWNEQEILKKNKLVPIPQLSAKIKPYSTLYSVSV